MSHATMAMPTGGRSEAALEAAPGSRPTKPRKPKSTAKPTQKAAKSARGKPKATPRSDQTPRGEVPDSPPTNRSTPGQTSEDAHPPTTHLDPSSETPPTPHAIAHPSAASATPLPSAQAPPLPELANVAALADDKCADNVKVLSGYSLSARVAARRRGRQKLRSQTQQDSAAGTAQAHGLAPEGHPLPVPPSARDPRVAAEFTRLRQEREQRAKRLFDHLDRLSVAPPPVEGYGGAALGSSAGVRARSAPREDEGRAEAMPAPRGTPPHARGEIVPLGTPQPWPLTRPLPGTPPSVLPLPVQPTAVVPASSRQMVGGRAPPPTYHLDHLTGQLESSDDASAGLLRMLRGRDTRRWLRGWLAQDGRAGKVRALIETAPAPMQQTLIDVLCRLLDEEQDDETAARITLLGAAARESGDAPGGAPLPALMGPPGSVADLFGPRWTATSPMRYTFRVPDEIATLVKTDSSLDRKQGEPLSLTLAAAAPQGYA
jgi:hypothetical protein